MVGGLWPEIRFVENLIPTHPHRGFDQPIGCLISDYFSYSLKFDLQWQLFLFLSLSYSVEEEMAAEMEVHGDK